MKSSIAVLLALVAFLQTVFGFAPFQQHPRALTASSTQLAFGPFSGPKDDGSPGDYVCNDCGYVFTKGPKAWAALPADYSCPPCGAPKYRFKKVPKGSASGKVEVKKSWF